MRWTALSHVGGQPRDAYLYATAPPNPASLFAKDLIENEFVRARVIMSLSNMIALRDLLNDKIRSDQAGVASASAGATKH